MNQQLTQTLRKP